MGLRVPIYTPTEGGVAPSEAQLRAPDVSSGLDDIAAGGQRFGAGIDQYAQSRATIMDMSAQTVARAQGLQNTQAWSKNTAQYTTLQGQNAVDAQTDTLKQNQDIYDAGMKAMPNPLAQKYYALHAGPTLAAANDAVYDHAIKQTHVAFGQQLSAETSAAQDTVAGLYADPDKFGAALPSVSDKARAEAAFSGMSGEAADEYVKNKTGEVVHSAIRTALAQDMTPGGAGGVDLATAISKKYGGDNLPFAIRQQVDQELAEPLLNRHATAIVNAAKAGSTAQPVADDNGNWTVPKVATPAPGGDGTPAASADYQMPVPGARVTSPFGAPRPGGKTHDGVDLAVPVNTPVKSAAVGTVIQAEPNGKGDSGNFVVVRHPDGMVSSYSHLGNVTVQQGDQVNANTVVGTVGLTGHATGAHVHVRMKDANGDDVDPMSVLGGKPGAVAAVTSPGALAVPDEVKVLANIDAMNLPPEMTQRAKSIATQQFRQVHAAQDFQNEQASQQAMGWVANWSLAHNNQYPPPEAIPSSILNGMRPDQAAELKLKVAKGRQDDIDAANGKAQSTHYADLQVMRYDHPDQYLALDPKALIGQVSAGQWNEIRVSQAEMRAQQNKPQPFDPYGGSSKALETYARFNPDILPKPSDSAYGTQRAALLDGIRVRAIDFVVTKHQKPSAADWNAFAQGAAHQTVATPRRSGSSFGAGTKPAYQISGSDIPSDKRQTIIASYQKAHPGRAPTEQEIADRYRVLAQ